MNTDTLSFAQIHILEDDIAEVIVNEGIEITLAMVGEYHDFLPKEMSHPFAVLINKKNAYTYTFDAQRHLWTLPEFRAIAILAYNDMTVKVTHGLISIQREISCTIKIFNQRDVGLQWLTDED